MAAIVDPTGYPMLCDTITVELHDVNSPDEIAFSASSAITIYGNGSFVFPPTVLGNTYYIVVQYRNAMETWSKNALLFNSTIVSFDFTSP